MNPPCPPRAKKAAEEEAWSALGDYFATKQAATLSPVPPLKVDNEDESFCRMLSHELRKLKNASIKRQTKRQILDIVYYALEQKEQQTVQAIQLPTMIAVYEDLPTPVLASGLFFPAKRPGMQTKPPAMQPSQRVCKPA